MITATAYNTGVSIVLCWPPHTCTGCAGAASACCSAGQLVGQLGHHGDQHQVCQVHPLPLQPSLLCEETHC